MDHPPENTSQSTIKQEQQPGTEAPSVEILPPSPPEQPSDAKPPAVEISPPSPPDLQKPDQLAAVPVIPNTETTRPGVRT